MNLLTVFSLLFSSSFAFEDEINPSSQLIRTLRANEAAYQFIKIYDKSEKKENQEMIKMLLEFYSKHLFH